MMTDAEDNAYPYVTHDQEGRVGEIQFGLTKREYFAAMAMNKYLEGRHLMGTPHESHVASMAVKYADALIEELNKPVYERH